jgi:alkyl hydroperoxide reductase subunit AhpC
MADKRLFDQLNVQLLAISVDTTFSQKNVRQIDGTELPTSQRLPESHDHSAI